MKNKLSKKTVKTKKPKKIVKKSSKKIKAKKEERIILIRDPFGYKYFPEPGKKAKYKRRYYRTARAFIADNKIPMDRYIDICDLMEE